MKTITKRQFRFLLTAFLALVVLSVMAEEFEVRSLPEPLADYRSAQIEAEWTVLDWVEALLFGVIGICFIYALIGLYRLWPSARPLAVGTLIASLVFSVIWLPFDEPYFYTPLAALLEGIAGMLFGAILALIYFSPVAEWFDRRRDVVEPNGASQ